MQLCQIGNIFAGCRNDQNLARQLAKISTKVNRAFQYQYALLRWVNAEVAVAQFRVEPAP